VSDQKTQKFELRKQVMPVADGGCERSRVLYL
jgi:hypothetical protein